MPRNPLTLVLLAAATTFVTNPTRAEETALIGKPVRDFRLPDVLTGKDVRLSDLKDKVVVVIFYSHTCTFCRNCEARFRQLAADQGTRYSGSGKGVAVLAIDSTGRTSGKLALKVLPKVGATLNCKETVEALGDDSCPVPGAMRRVLLAAGPDALPVLSVALKHTNPTIRRAAENILKRMPRPAPAAGATPNSHIQEDPNRRLDDPV